MLHDDIRTRLRPAGSLGLSEARELIALRSVPGAYLSDGRVAEDTLRRWGVSGEQRGRHRAPEELDELDVVEIHQEPAVWGGGMLAHYGHFVIESVSRLWPLLPGGELEGLPVVFATPLEAERAYEWLDAFGARRIDLPEQGAARFVRLYVPEPAWRIDAWVAPEIRQIHLHARRALEVPASPPCDVLWLSRSRLPRRRRAYDECLLEWILRDHVTVFHPETATLTQQIAAIEASGVVAGVLGSAFHSLLMASRVPDCLYLRPSPETVHGADHRFQDAYLAQDRILNAVSEYVYACVPTGVTEHRVPGGYRLAFPAGYRLLIPEALRGLRETVLPDLFEDPRAVALSRPERVRPGRSGIGGELIAAVARVLQSPLSAELRIELGGAFHAEGLADCALEQFLAAADLAAEPAPALLRAKEVAGDGTLS